MSGLPSGWATVALGDVARIVAKLVDPVDFPEAPHIAPNHIESETGRLLPFRTVIEDGVTSPKYAFRKGDVLYSKIRPYLAKVTVAPFDGLCSADMYPLATDQNPRYLAYWLVSPMFTALAAGHQGRSVLPKINRAALFKLPVPLPDFAEQERIVAAMEEQFSRLDAAEGSIQRAHEQAGSLHRMLVRSAVNGNHAPARSLVECVDVLDSLRVPVNAAERAARPGKIPYYGATGQVGWIDDALFDEELVLLGEDGAPFLDQSKPKAYVISGPSWVNNHAHVLRARSGVVDSSFLKFALDCVDFHPLVTGTTRLKLTQGQMKSISIPLPDLAIQKDVVAELSRQESVLAALRASAGGARRKAAALRSSILHAAFSGRLSASLLEARAIS